MKNSNSGAPNRMQDRQAFALATVLAGALLLGFLQPIANNDIGFHLRLGADIVRTRVIPRVDQYSFTAAGAPYLDHEWLPQLAFFAIDRAAGVAGIVVFTSACIALCFALLLWTLRRDLTSAMALVILIAPLGVSHAQARPHVFAWLLLATLVAMIEARRTAAVIVLLVVWANSHASFMLGVGLAAAAFVERFLVTRDRRQLGWAAACILAPLLNPHGVGLFTYFLHIHPSTDFISEWQAFAPTSGYFYCWIAFVLTLVIGLARARWQNPMDWLRAVALVTLGFTAMRHAVVAAMALLPLQHRLWSATITSLRSRWPRAVQGSLLAVIGAGLAALVMFKDACQLRVDHEALPVYATEFLLDQPIAGPLFNDYDFGGYLIWKAGDRHRVFVDGRVDVYIGKPLDDYLTISRVRPGWQALLDAYGVNCCFVRADREIGRVLANDRRWEMVYFDYNTVIYVRAGTSPSVRRIRYTTPWRHRDGSKLADLIDELGYLLDHNPKFFGGHKILAALYHRAGNITAARNEMSRYLELHPSGRRDAETHLMLERFGMNR